MCIAALTVQRARAAHIQNITACDCRARVLAQKLSEGRERPDVAKGEHRAQGFTMFIAALTYSVRGLAYKTAHALDSGIKANAQMAAEQKH
eukprot:6212221-Pleurochrysis_carterae.AAC.3